MGAQRFSRYRDKDNKFVFLDDVIRDDNPNELDESKLPDDVREGVEIRFKWDNKLNNYVMHTKQKVTI